MRSLKLKTTCRNGQVHTTLANPSAPLGDNSDRSVQTRQVNDIPPGIENAQVVMLFKGTADVSPFDTPRLEFKFSELGIGRIVK